MSTNANKVFVDVSNSADKIAKGDKQRKATDTAKERRRKSKYAGKENSQQARKAYNRYDNGTCPEDIVDDMSPAYLQQVKDGFYATKVVVTPEEASMQVTHGSENGKFESQHLRLVRWQK